MFSWVPPPLKQRIKGPLRTLRSAWVRRWYAFSRDDLLASLKKVGVQPGDVLLVHSSFGRFEGFTGTATEAIAVLQEAVGPEGTVLMPTMPFDGSALDYVAEGTVLDVRRTPSKMGLLTELFRRYKDVQRSAHPTHPVAVRGPRAEALIADHHRAGTPCGRQSPFGRLLDFDGKILFLGVPVNVMTFFHTIEEILEPQMPFSVFTPETYDLEFRDANGALQHTRTRLFARNVPTRTLAQVTPILKRQGGWRTGRVGRLSLLLVRAREVLAACQGLADCGVFCYDL